MKNIRIHYIALGLLVSFVSLCGLRAGATPITDNKGGFPDELFHFARSLQSTKVMAETMSISIPDLDANSLMKFSTRVDSICELGFEDRSSCPEFFESRDHIKFPISSGEIRGRGVYFIHGLIQLLLPEITVQSRLMFGRVFAICIGVALTYVVYSLAHLLFKDNRLAIASAVLVGLMPSVSNIISAVSTEGPALLAVGLVLLAAANIAVRGYALTRLFWLGFGIAACLFTKMTAIVPLPIVVLLLLHKTGIRWRWLFLTSLFVFTIIVIGYSTYTPEKVGVAHWYLERDPGSISVHGTPVRLAQGKYTKSIDVNMPDISDNKGLISFASIECYFYGTRGPDCASLQDSIQPESILQYLPVNIASNLAGKIVTVGAWVYAPGAGDFRSPDILLTYDNSGRDILEGEISTSIHGWQFISHEVSIPEGVTQIAVRLYAPEYIVFFWDNVVLAEGSFAGSGEPPVFDDGTASGGQWNGFGFTNLIKNGSAEKSWMGVPQEAFYLMSKYGSGTWANRLNGQLFSFYDFERTSVGYIDGLRAMFVTFWGSFAGGDWPGLARWHYVVAIGFLMVSVVGWVRYAWLQSVVKPVMLSDITLLLLLITALYIGVGLLRMEVSAEWSSPLYYATARFLLPAIIPVVLLGVGGIDLLKSKRISRYIIAVLVACVFMANTWMLLRVELPYFNCTSEIRWTCTDL